MSERNPPIIPGVVMRLVPIYCPDMLAGLVQLLVLYLLFMEDPPQTSFNNGVNQSWSAPPAVIDE